MKKSLSLILGILLISSFAFSQQDKLEFVQKKTDGIKSTVYFDVVGIHNQAHADAILEALTDDPNIEWGRYFISSSNKDRYQLVVTSSVTAEYVLNILQNNGVDYDYSSISKNGYVASEDKSGQNVELQYQRSPVDYPGFPKYVNTGNQIEDEKRYADEKNKWISEHPAEYEQMLKDTENK